jgi:flagellar motility protein MotE (MotC chaperone)
MSKLPRILPLIAVAVGGVLAVRAIGVAPGLFEGATAWAQEAEPAAAAPKAAPAVCALSEAQLAEQIGISPAELRIISSLGDRRKELDARDADFATMLPLLAAAEQKLDARVQELEAIKTEVQGLLGQVDEKAKAETDRMVAVYSAMRPREAAAVFAGLDDSVLLPVAAAMRPRTLAAILAQMPPAEARALTEKLAARYQAAPLAARAAVAAGPTPAPPAAAAAAAPVAGAGATAAPAPASASPAQTAAAAPRQSSRPAPAPRRPPARPPQSRAQTAPTPAADTPPAATPAAATPPTTPAQRPRQSVE